MLLLYSKSIKCILTALYCIRVTHTQFYNLHINTCKLQWGLFTFKCRQITNSLVLLIGWAKYQWVIWFVKKWFREIVRIWPANFLSFYKSLPSPWFLFLLSSSRFHLYLTVIISNVRLVDRTQNKAVIGQNKNMITFTAGGLFILKNGPRFTKEGQRFWLGFHLQLFSIFKPIYCGIRNQESVQLHQKWTKCQ